jgi:hypothetical protein
VVDEYSGVPVATGALAVRLSRSPDLQRTCIGAAYIAETTMPGLRVRLVVERVSWLKMLSRTTAFVGDDR